MSTFSVPVKRIRAIEPHPNADAIELAVIDGYRSIVRKDQFAAGDLVAYLPEQALLPEWMLKRLGFWDDAKGKGTLNGPCGNRIKAVKLRGEISQGICWPVITGPNGNSVIVCGGDLYDAVNEGDDVALTLGVTKWEPEIPASMSGEVWNAGTDFTVNFDVENIKSYPEAIREFDFVTMTEKLHGTFTGITVLPLGTELKEPGFGRYGNILIWSKGLGAKGLVFKNNEKNASNLYVRSTKKMIEDLDAAHEDGLLPYDNFRDVTCYHLMGETFGPGIQDLTYEGKVEFRLFGLANREKSGQLRNFSYLMIKSALHIMCSAVQMVPLVYAGPFSQSVLDFHTVGSTTLLARHIREGVVVQTSGGLRLKSINPAYLVRKNATEFN